LAADATTDASCSTARRIVARSGSRGRCCGRSRRWRCRRLPARLGRAAGL